MSHFRFFNRLNTVLKYNSPIKYQFQYRNSSYQNSSNVGPIESYTSKFETTNSPADWKYVERILAPIIVPTPKAKSEYPSNWKPPNVYDADKKPYFVNRSRNHMIPVYLQNTFRGTRKITIVRHVQGDIFLLEKELKQHLEMTLKKDVATQVNEFCEYINIKGDHVRLVEQFLLDKGF